MDQIKIFGISLIVLTLRVTIIAWCVMIGIGIVHHEWLTNMPTIGWHGAVIVSAIGMLCAETAFPETGTHER